MWVWNQLDLWHIKNNIGLKVNCILNIAIILDTSLSIKIPHLNVLVIFSILILYSHVKIYDTVIMYEFEITTMNYSY